MGLYSGGLIIERTFVSEISGAYFWVGFFIFWGGGGGLIIGILRLPIAISDRIIIPLMFAYYNHAHHFFKHLPPPTVEYPYTPVGIINSPGHSKHHACFNLSSFVIHNSLLFMIQL